MVPGSSPRVRFAPNPSGYLHVGGAWSALFNWLYARGSGGTFLIRIEDTDPSTAKPEMIDPLLEALTWLGIDWDEGPYRQSERTELYREAAAKLLTAGRAYLVDADDRPVEGTEWHEGLAMRFGTPDAGSTLFTDIIRGDISFENETIEDFVLWRSNDRPSFYLANAVDDVDMGITHAIRGDDLLSSTPRILLVQRALGHEQAQQYAHLPTLVDEQRRKLSKRKGDVAVGDYRERGYLREAIVNYLATLGWGPPDGVEIRPLDEIRELFRLEDVNPSPAFFDIKKLTHFNGEWIRRSSLDEFVAAAGPFLDNGPWPAERFDSEVFRRIAPLVQERVATLEEIPPMVDFLFLPEPELDRDAWEKAVARNALASAILDGAIEAFADTAWTADALKEALLAVGERHDLKLAKTQAPVRVAVTGRTVGPPLFESMELLGRETTLDRLRAARARL